MQKSNLQIEPYTLNEALICLNKSFKLINRKQIALKTLYNIIYGKAKVELIKQPKKPILIQYNSIVDIYEYMTTKRYPSNRKSRHAN